jgi:hypothetical protein
MVDDSRPVVGHQDLFGGGNRDARIDRLVEVTARFVGQRVIDKVPALRYGAEMHSRSVGITTRFC